MELRRVWLAFAGLILAGYTVLAAVIDRVAVTVGKDVITLGEVLDEIRVTAFLNQALLDFSPAARRAAADRLVDQYLIRDEMQLEGFAQPRPEEAEKILRQFKRKHFRTPEQYQAALKKYGITEEELKEHLLWQVAALRFTEQRFRTGSPPPAVPVPKPTRQAAVRAQNEADRQIQRSNGSTKAGAPAPDPTANVDQQLDAWLKQARAQTKIEFRKEAFE